MVGTKLTLKTVGFVGSIGSVHNFPWDHDGIKNMKYPSPMEGDGTRERERGREGSITRSKIDPELSVGWNREHELHKWPQVRPEIIQHS